MKYTEFVMHLALKWLMVDQYIDTRCDLMSQVAHPEHIKS